MTSQETSPIAVAPAPAAQSTDREPPTFTRLGTLAELTLGLSLSGTDDGFMGYNGDGSTGGL